MQSVLSPDPSVTPSRQDRPSIPETRRAIAAEITIAAIRRYEETVRRDDDLGRRIADDDALGNWHNVMINERSDAEANLIRAIAARIARKDYEVDDAPCRRWPVCGVAFGDKLYLIVPDFGHHEFVPVGEKPEEDSQEWITHLAIGDRSAVIDLDPPAEPTRPAPPVEPPAPPVGVRARDPERDADIEAAVSADFAPRSRPGPRRTFLTTVACYEQGRVSRVGLTVEGVVREELDDFRAAEEHCQARGYEYDHADADDLSIWEDNKLRAVIFPRADGPPRVVIFDPEDPGETIPAVPIGPALG
jgi:hypothetical protein